MDFIVNRRNLRFAHCAKSLRIRSYSGPYFLEFELNSNHNNCKSGHSLRSGIFIDMTAAVAKVWGQNLLLKLHETGIKGRALLWIRKLFSDITVRYNDVLSTRGKLFAGAVPQGSILSPLLFIVLYNAIEKQLKK